MKMKNSIKALTIAAALSVATFANAITLNGGWESDQIDAAQTDSQNSTYFINLLESAVFSITDAFIVGDTFFVYDFGSLILTTSVAAGTPFTPSNGTADSAWESGSYSIGSVALAAGSHEITIQGDGAGGVPAGLFVRLDSASSVPDSGATLALLGLAMGSIALLRRKRA